jgi:hypothetical protein
LLRFFQNESVDYPTSYNNLHETPTMTIQLLNVAVK